MIFLRTKIWGKLSKGERKHKKKADFMVTQQNTDNIGKHTYEASAPTE